MNPLCGVCAQKDVDRERRAVRDGRVTDREISTRRSDPAVLEHSDSKNVLVCSATALRRAGRGACIGTIESFCEAPRSS